MFNDGKKDENKARANTFLYTVFIFYDNKINEMKFQCQKGMNK